MRKRPPVALCTVHLVDLEKTPLGGFGGKTCLPCYRLLFDLDKRVQARERARWKEQMRLKYGSRKEKEERAGKDLRGLL